MNTFPSLKMCRRIAMICRIEFRISFALVSQSARMREYKNSEWVVFQRTNICGDAKDYNTAATHHSRRKNNHVTSSSLLDVANLHLSKINLHRPSNSQPERHMLLDLSRYLEFQRIQFWGFLTETMHKVYICWAWSWDVWTYRLVGTKIIYMNY